MNLSPILGLNIGSSDSEKLTHFGMEFILTAILIIISALVLILEIIQKKETQLIRIKILLPLQVLKHKSRYNCSNIFS